MGKGVDFCEWKDGGACDLVCWCEVCGMCSFGRGGIGGTAVCGGFGDDEVLAPKGRELRDSALRKEGRRFEGLVLVSAALLMNWW